MEALPYILIINGALLALFVAWVVTSQMWGRFTGKVFAKKVVVPPYGALVKIKTVGAIYESRFMGVTSHGWAIETLAQAIPAVRLGESAVVEISCEKGVVRFRSELVDLLDGHNATVMRPPTETLLGNRRNQKRLLLDNRPTVFVEGTSSIMQDLSEGGARISTPHLLRTAERVKVEIPGHNEPLLGHVLEVIPNKTRGYANDVRVVFEKPVKLNGLKKKLAPAG
jgi:hypothetical protein